MNINKKIHQGIRLQNIIFNVLFFSIIGLLAWLSTQYSVQADWTANSKNTLSSPSQQLLAKLDKPILIEAYIAQDDFIRKQTQRLIRRYQVHKKDIQLKVINPDKHPEKAREEAITAEGQLVIHYAGRRESIISLNEQSITNALQRLANSRQRWVVFLSGHGERSPVKEANFDMSVFGQALVDKGYNIQSLNLVETPAIPQNTSLIVLASPQTALLTGEMNTLKEYLDSGGALLWLSEPNQAKLLEPLAKHLAIRFLPGVVVDASTQTFGIDDPTFALITQYSQHISTAHIQAMSLFPGAQGISVPLTADNRFTTQAILSTLKRSWTETGQIAATSKEQYSLQFDANSNEQAGPIDIGLVLSRPVKGNDSLPAQTQRLAVIGDGDFLSNTYLGNGANLDVGLSLIRWLNHDDSFIDIPAKTSADTSLEVSSAWTIIFGLGFLLLLPISFMAIGTLIWLKRKKR